MVEVEHNDSERALLPDRPAQFAFQRLFHIASARGSDIACRYGGEEFTLILPDAPLTATFQRAEQLREKFRHLEVMYQSRSLPAGTLSLGVAGFPEHGTTVEDILRAADVALYRAKHDGRDRVMVAGTVG